jgi:flagellar L-ring protein precursor FlgH
MHFKNRTALFCCAALAIPLVATANANAQSLWNQRQSHRAFLFYDTPARQVGDILTVLVAESTDVENRDQRALDRDARAGGGFSLSGAISGALGSKATDANFNTSANGNGTFDGSSAYSVERGFVDRITVTVVERMPNGNLRIFGRRERIVSGERRALKITGVVRPLDVAPDNTIQSQFIANFRVCYDGDGIESRFTDEGWMTRAWNKYRPF